MKILHTVESYDPAGHGMQQVVKQISERLVKSGHEITIATSFHPERKELLINGVRIEQFEISGKTVTGINATESEINRYQNFLLNSDFDIITNFAAQQWSTDLAFPILNKIKSIKIFVPTGFSEINNLIYGSYYDSMKSWMKEYDMNIFLSDDYQDINFAKNNGVEKRIVIPNGASLEEFEYTKDECTRIRKTLSIPESQTLILHVGSHTGLKGHAEAIRIFNKAKIRNATLLIVGNTTNDYSIIKHVSIFFIKIILNQFSFTTKKQYFPACDISCKTKAIISKFSIHNFIQNKRIIIKELSRKDTIAAYQAADLFLFPSNIECSPIVLFEAMASKTPFLSSDVGNAKEITFKAKSGIILPTAKMINGIQRVDIHKSSVILQDMIQNHSLLDDLANNGYKHIKNRYNWQTISTEYASLYDSLLVSRKN